MNFLNYKKFRLPSRNWLIFIGISSSIAGYYGYDRRECRRIRADYTQRVKYLAEQVPDSHLSFGKKVLVYGCKWPEDENYDQPIKYFKKYIKPILVAAAVDYDIVNGKRHGELATTICETVKQRRRDNTEWTDDAVIVVGRPAWKEFLAGLSCGWTEGLDRVDADELLAKELEGGEPATIPSIDSLPPPPPVMGRVPPILLVPFIDYIGFTQIPLMLWDFMNRRRHVLAGAEAAQRLITGHSRKMTEADLAFDSAVEGFYHKRSRNIGDNIEKARQEYYQTLQSRLENAKDEAEAIQIPIERMEKEKRWRSDRKGWEIVLSPPVWDDRFQYEVLVD